MSEYCPLVQVSTILGLSIKRVLKLVSIGIFQPTPFSERTPEAISERIISDYLKAHADDEHLSRADTAHRLGISANRVSELTTMGVLEPISLKPLSYPANHSKACYKDYRDWLEHKKNREQYALVDLSSQSPIEDGD
jgi:hypothetical protein